MEKTVTNNEKESLLLSSGKFGLKGIKYFALILFLFGGVNLIIFIASIYPFLQTERTYVEILLFIGILLAGIVFTIAAFYLTYKYLVLDGIYVVYKQMENIIRKICSLIMNKIGTKPIDKANETRVDKIFNTQDVVEGVYGRKVPRPIQWGISFIIKQIPFISLLAEVKNARNNLTEEEAQEQFYQSVDSYIRISIFETNNMKWIYWLLPINVVVQGVLIYFLVR